MARFLALLVPLALLGGAYVSQYGFGLYPCEMCWWQRYAHFAALPFAVLALIAPRQGRALVALAGLAIAAAASPTASLPCWRSRKASAAKPSAAKWA